MSLTQWLTRSAPHVSWRPAATATLSFVPTPSVEATSTGSRYREKSGRKSPPNPPMSPMTPGVKVERIASFARASAPAFASMSTPAAEYRDSVKGQNYSEQDSGRSVPPHHGEFPDLHGVRVALAQGGPEREIRYSGITRPPVQHDQSYIFLL